MEALIFLAESILVRDVKRQIRRDKRYICEVAKAVEMGRGLMIDSEQPDHALSLCGRVSQLIERLSQVLSEEAS